MKIRFSVPEATDPRREGGMQLPPQQGKRTSARWRWLLVVLLALSPGLLVGGYLLRGWLWVDAGGFVFFEELPVTAPGPGTVVAVQAAAGKPVEPGAPLVELQNPELAAEAAALQAATRHAGRSSPELAALDRQVAALRAARQARQDELSSLRALQAAGAATRGEVLAARERAGAAEAALAAAERDRASALALLDASGQTTADQASRLAVLTARLEALKVAAPAAGLVDSVVVQRGQRVAAGEPLLVLRRGEPQVVGFLPGRELALSTGDEVRLVLPDGTTLRGRVIGQAPSTLRLPEELSSSFEPRTARLQVLIAPEGLPPQARVHRLPVTVRLFRFRW
ncbi:MAG: biotin/lipoyl-binding protein [Anaeromyxobacter sp.]